MLHNKAMLVTLNISQPKQHTIDKAATSQVIATSGAQRGSASVVKNLFDKKDYAPIKKKLGEIRSKHYFMTAPWLDSGPRILPSKLFIKYTEQMRELQTEAERLIDNFCDGYEDRIVKEQLRLNGLFNQDDYPSPSEVRNAFGIRFSYAPVPTGDDFRVEGVDEEQLEAIRQDIIQREKQANEAVLQEAITRIKDAVGHMSDRLNDPKAKFHDTLVTNIRELLEVLPAMNIEEDSQFDELCNEVDSRLASVEADDLRRDSKLRSSVASDADKIFSKMAHIYG